MALSEIFQKAKELHNLGKLDAAIAAYQEVIRLDEHFHAAWFAQGCAWEKKEDDASALICFQKALSLAPNDGASHHNLARALHRLGFADEAIEHFHTALGLGKSFLPRTSIATIIPGSPKADNRTILEARRSWAEIHLPPVDPHKKFERAPHEGRRLRVGYLSSFFQSRNWMKPVWALINHHNRECFEIHIFSDAPETACRDCYRNHPTDLFHDITNLSNRAAAERIEECKLDLLVDLNGYSRIDRLAVVAQKPAPIIVGWFNLYATSGMLCYDYLIGDNEVIPPEEEGFYTEKILRIPGCYLTFEVLYPIPDVVDPPMLFSGSLTFGCLASQYKITEPVVDAWSRILHSTQDTRLFLKNATLGCESNRELQARRFEARGVARNRIVMEGPAEHFDYLAAYGRMDIALDTFPYNGGTTTSEAIWQGVPVLTFPGERWAARQSTSINKAAGLAKFVAHNLDDYIARAVAWAHSAETPNLLAKLRRGMRGRLAGYPLCDTAGFAKNMEQLYKTIAKGDWGRP
ncbi:MAG TPA: tetratricopeptide repeat protein [Anaerolineales bacterium]|nr:tetratricopeptide repeat protein [Anaerolineales bacterium]